MSPEQARGQQVDNRADVWAFGCVLYEMLTGRRAFSGTTVTDTLAAIMRDQPDWSRLPAETPPMVRWLTARCLEKDPRHRLQDLGDARLILDDGVLDLCVKHPGVPTVAPASMWSRSRAGWIAAGVIGLGLVGTGSVALRHWRETPPPPERAVQFTILPHEGMQFGRPLHLALSPDGRYLAFTAGSGPASSLWLRPIHSTTARPLTGTDGAALPFWSPDSQSIAFFSSGKLQVIRIDGGPPVTVCAVATGRGGAWNSDNVIVFSPAADAPLQRVSASGGTPTPVTTLDPPRENSHRMPAFLPDGRHFFLLAGGQAASGGIAWQVKLGSLDAPGTVKVADADLGSSPAYSRGHLLYARNRTLMALRFDSTTRQPSGAAFTVTDQPVSSATATSAAFAASPDGLLAFMAAEDLTSRLAWVDRTGKVTPVGEAGVHFSAAIAPDERLAAVASETGPLRGRDIWIVDLVKGGRTKLTVDPAAENFPLWSPDGTTVYFSSSRNGAANIFRKAADGSGPEELLYPSDRSQYPSDISRDGQSIIFTQVTATGTDVWVLPLAGERKPRPIVQGPSAKGNAALSPDGRWIAFQSNESGRDEIYVVAYPDGGTPRRLSSNGGAVPLWRGDGLELFYIAAGSVVAASLDHTGSTSGGPPRILFPLRRPAIDVLARTYDVTRNGRRFLTAMGEGTPTRNPVNVFTNWLAAVR